jgi:hypothetical protein
MKHSLIAIALASALALPYPALVQAADAPVAAAQTETGRGYLGVTINRLPESLRAQLPNTVPPQQGVLVEQVLDGSPAQKAGLQPFDILLQYDDQKLFSPEQLTRLVGSDSSGQAVQLTIVRGGKISTLTATLGEHEPREVQRFPQSWLQPMPFQGFHPHRGMHPITPAQQSSEASWESFDALSLEKLKDGQYKAEIGYLTSDGSHKRLEFRGTRDEIRQKILAQNDLPDLERGQLLAALTARGSSFPTGWPDMPFEQDFPAPPPWWGWHPDF